MYYFFQYLLVFFLSIFVNGLLSVPLINFLYKKRFYKKKNVAGVDTSSRNPSFYNYLESNLDTPSSFGVLLLVNVFLVGALTFYKVNSIFIITFILFLILGLLDDVVKFFLYKRLKRWGLSIWVKLLLQVLVLLPIVIFSGFSFYFSIFYLLFVIFILNSLNITDGLDGLVGTILLYIIPVLFYFEWFLHNDFYSLIFLSVIFGFNFIFLYFNIKPARIFLGDVGSLPLGFFIAFFGLRYNLIPVLVLFSLIIIEGTSSLTQLLSIKFFKKKVFVIAPLHLHLLNKGWTDTKIVQRSGILQLVLSLIAIYLFNVL